MEFNDVDDWEEGVGGGWVEFKDVEAWKEGVWGWLGWLQGWAERKESGMGLGGLQGCRGLGRGSSGMGLGGFKVGVRVPSPAVAGEGKGEGGGSRFGVNVLASKHLFGRMASCWGKGAQRSHDCK